jgi:archaellum component FlaC
MTKLFSEKYIKQLTGMAKIEEALKKLDKLRQEEGLMATAQALKVGHTVDNRVRGVADTLLAVDNRVASVDDKVTCVDDRVAGVEDRVASVDDRVAGVDAKVASIDGRVRAIDDKFTAFIDSTHHIFNRSSNKRLTQCA